MKSFVFLLLAGASLVACAQSGSPDQKAAIAKDAKAAVGDEPAFPAGSNAARAVAAIHRVNPKVKVETASDAPLAGFQQVVVGGTVVYVSNDGKYLLQGSLYDTVAKRDLSERTMAGVRRELLKSIPASDRIVFAPPKPKYSVVVFTDVECPFCQKLHSEIADYNRQGIAIEYVAFPRMGLGTPDYDKMVSVWCASDRRKALTEAKGGQALAPGKCRNPVAQQYMFGQRMGLQGTPMILAEDGTQLGGYVPPAELRADLDKHAADVAATAPARPASAGG